MAVDKPKFTRESAEKTIDELKEQLQEVTDAKTIEKIVKEDVEVDVTVTNSDMGGDLASLFGALSKAQSEFQAVGKNKQGHGYAFSNFQNVVESTSPVLSKHGLAVTQLLITKMHGKTLLSGVKTILAHSSGGYISGDSYVPTFKTKMNGTTQVYGVNTSYLKRYGWLSVCGVATTEEDTDGVS